MTKYVAPGICKDLSPCFLIYPDGRVQIHHTSGMTHGTILDYVDMQKAVTNECRVLLYTSCIHRQMVLMKVAGYRVSAKQVFQKQDA